MIKRVYDISGCLSYLNNEKGSIWKMFISFYREHGGSLFPPCPRINLLSFPHIWRHFFI